MNWPKTWRSSWIGQKREDLHELVKNVKIFMNWPKTWRSSWIGQKREDIHDFAKSWRIYLCRRKLLLYAQKGLSILNFKPGFFTCSRAGFLSVCRCWFDGYVLQWCQIQVLSRPCSTPKKNQNWSRDFIKPAQEISIWSVEKEFCVGGTCHWFKKVLTPALRRLKKKKPDF